MPTYQYACTACAERLEAVQSFHDAPLTQCPACGGTLRKVFSAVGVVFKGSGFYKTDSRNGAARAGGAAESGGDGAATGGGKAEGSGDKGSADKGSGDKGSADKGSGDKGSGGTSTPAASPSKNGSSASNGSTSRSVAPAGKTA